MQGVEELAAGLPARPDGERGQELPQHRLIGRLYRSKEDLQAGFGLAPGLQVLRDRGPSCRGRKPGSRRPGFAFLPARAAQAERRVRYGDEGHCPFPEVPPMDIGYAVFGDDVMYVAPRQGDARPLLSGKARSSIPSRCGPSTGGPGCSFPAAPWPRPA